MKASWKKGYPAKGDAQDCYNELERIRIRDGHLTADSVMEEAKDPSNPLHADIFTCNPKEAAKNFYKLNAAKVIRSIEVIRESHPRHPARRYEVTTITTESKALKKVYSSTEEILADPIARDELLGQAIRDALAFRRRYQMLSELSLVFSSMDEFLRKANP